MKKFLAASLTAAALFAGHGAYAADNSADLEKKLQDLSEQLQRTQADMAAMKAQMSGQDYVTRDEASRLIRNEMTQVVDERVEQGFAQHRDSSPILSLGEGVDNLDIVGDLTLRAEHAEFNDIGGEDFSDDQFAMRLRLGAVWSSEGWEVGVGFTTTTDTDGDAYGDATNQYDVNSQYSAFQSRNLWLDYAYAKHTWGDFSLTLGQQHNPYATTFILWDEDVNPIGVTAQYAWEGFTATGGIYDVINNGVSEAEGYLGAGEVKYKYTYDQLDLTVAAAWYYFSENVTNDGNVTNVTVPDTYQYNLGSLFGEAGYNLQDTVRLSVYGQVVQNFGADGDLGQVGSHFNGSEDPSEKDLAWIGGTKVRWQDFYAGYAYAHIEADAVPVALNDHDFGRTVAVNGTNGVNVSGHKLTLGYDITKNVAVELNAFFVEPTDSTDSSHPQEGRLYQVDAIWTF